MSHVKLVYDSTKGIMVPKSDAGTHDQGTTQSKQRRICYVDDSRTSTYVTNKMLRQYGYEVEHFASGDEALEAILERDYDLLITDLVMTGGDGVNGDDLIRLLRNSGHPAKAELPIVVVTGTNDGATVDSLYGAGADEVLFKPVKATELDAVIKNLIAAKGAESEAPAPPQAGDDEDVPVLDNPVSGNPAEPHWSHLEVPVSDTLDAFSEPADQSSSAGQQDDDYEFSAVHEYLSSEERGDWVSSLLDGFDDRPSSRRRGGEQPPEASLPRGEDGKPRLSRHSVKPPDQPLGDDDLSDLSVARMRGRHENREVPPREDTAAPPGDDTGAWPPGFEVTPPASEAPPSTPPETPPEPPPRPAPAARPPEPPSRPAGQEDNPLMALLDDLDNKHGGEPSAFQSRPSEMPAVSGSPRRRSGAGRWGLLLALVLAVGAGGAWYWYQPAEQVQLVGVTQGDVFEAISVPGRVVSKREVDLSSYYPGQLLKVIVHEGDRVSRGDVLARLSNEEAKSRVKRAEAELLSVKEEVGIARKTVDRLQRALNLGAVSRQRVEDAEAEWKAASARQTVAEEELQAAKLRLERLKVKAPFDGLVTRVHAHPGQWIAPPEPMVTLVDLSRLQVELKVDSADSNRLEKGQKVVMHSDAYPNRNWEEHIGRIAPAADSNTAANTIEVYTTLSDGAPPLRVGQQVDAEIRLRASRNTLKLPFEALFTVGGQTHVAVVRDGKVRYVPVQTGLEDFTHVEIVEALKPGQKVILGAGDLREGQRVTAVSAR